MSLNRLKGYSKSVRLRIISMMAALVIVQAMVFVAATAGSGIIQRVDQHTMASVTAQVENRGSYLERIMVDRWSNIMPAVQDACRVIGSELERSHTPFEGLSASPESVKTILQSLSPLLLSTLRSNSVTGAFAVLDASLSASTGEEGIRRAALYYRDMEPNYNAPDDSDLLLLRGPADIAKKQSIPIDALWEYELDFPGWSEGSRDFFEKPFQMAKDYPQYTASELGYWSDSFRLSPDGLPVITYTVPLLGDSGTVYGVYGVEITVDYLIKQFPYTELSRETKGADGAYALLANRDGKWGEGYVISGPLLKQLDLTKAFQADEIGRNMDGFITIPGANGQELKLCGVRLNLYNKFTPFTNEQWYFAGVVTSHYATSMSTVLITNLAITVTLSAVIGLLLAFVMSGLFSHPIQKLSGQVRSMDPSKPVRLSKTGITELDKLGDAVEILSADVARTASKFSDIVDLLGLPLGIYEADYAARQVFLTDSLFAILNLPHTIRDSNYLPLDEWKELMDDRFHQENLCRFEHMEHREIYQMEGEDGSRWLEVYTRKTGSVTLGLINDVTKEILELLRLKEEHNYDSFTKLLNRNAFHAMVEEQIKRRPDETGAVIMWDLDNLKYVNDTYGHDTGDRYILSAADIFRQFSDENGLVSRMSGDEFILYLHFGNSSSQEGKDKIRGIIQQMVCRIENTTMQLPDGSSIRLRASAGLAWYPDDSNEVDTLIRYADFAMYEIKHTIKGDIKEFDIISYEKDSFLLQKKEVLNRFLDEGQAEFYFQPIVDCCTGQIFAYEALLRSKMEELRSPLEILQLAKSQSKLYQIEQMTLFGVMQTVQEKIGVFEGKRIFLNSIPSQMLSSKDIDQLYRHFQSIFPFFVFEITENEYSNEKYMRKKVSWIRDMGCSVAVDDFGSGYSNELMLLATNPDYVKVDISIVHGINSDQHRQHLFSNLVSYARDNGIKIIAEGVETPEEMDMVIALGTDYIQGYYLGKPSKVPADTPLHSTVKSYLDSQEAALPDIVK